MIRVSEPLLKGNEKKYLCEAIDEGEVSSGGRFVRRFEDAFAKWSGNDYAVAVSSGTAALETALWSTNYPRKIISVPTGTIISCFTSAIRAGFKVMLHDMDSRGFGVAIMRCHLFGKFDTTYGYPLVDDLSQYWKPYRVDVTGVYSLYANKMITSGEGGVMVTNDEDIYKNAKSYINLCHSKQRFKHHDMGYNFRMSNMQAAVALAQLEQIDNFIEIKQRNRDLYLKYLDPMLTPLFDVEVPWMYLVESLVDADVFVGALKAQGIEARRFFYPIHKQSFVATGESFPVAEHLWNHAFYIPSGLTLTRKDIIHVSNAICKVLRHF